MEGTKRYTRLMAGNETSFLHPTLLLIRSNAQGCTLQVTDKQHTVTHPNSADQQGMLVMAPGTLMVECGELSFIVLDFPPLAKLQVFIDKAQPGNPASSGRILSAYIPSSLDAHPTQRDVEYWLLGHALRRDAAIETFSAVLRQSEWYALVDFLFDSHSDDSAQRLQNLCARYGLSVSHFRRMSRRALGNTTKTALRDWRLGQALIDLVNDEHSLTTIAMNHGYASLSHFSNEVKGQLGMSPRNLKKILQAS